MNIRAFALLVLLALAATPVSTATPACNTFTQTRTVATLTVTVTTSSCYDSYADPDHGYGYQYWNNVTVTQVVDTSGASFALVDFGGWQHSYGPGYDTESWFHQYNVLAADGAGEFANSGAQESQSGWTNGVDSSCNGGAYAYSNDGARTGTYVGPSASQYWGDGQSLECTDRSTQEALP